MAKKYETSDFDFDSDFSIDSDFDFGGSSKKTGRDRHEELAMAALKGVGEGLTDSLLENTIRRALPKGYGTALDIYRDSKSGLESLYHDAYREIKPGMDGAKRLTKQLMPKIDGALPESVANFLKEWSQDTDRDGAGQDISPDKQRDNLMAMEIGAIFQGQAEIHKRGEERQDARDRIKEGLTQVRHRQEMKALTIIANSVHRQAEYQDKVLIGFQRKTLELQMRQYYATVDQLNIARQGFVMQKSLLESIRDYSRMPDFEKTTISSKFKELTRNRFIEQARDSFLGNGVDFFKKFSDNISLSIQNQVSQLATGFNMAIDGAQMAVDMGEAMGGLDIEKEGAQGVGKWLGGLLVNKAQDKLGGVLSKNKTIVKTGHRLTHGANNLQHTIKKNLENSGIDDGMGGRTWGPLEFLKNFLIDNLPNMRPDLGVQKDSLSSLDQPAPLTRLTMKTWNEVIPGFLARIHREIYQLRTGDQNAPLLAYDFTSNRFSTEKGIANSVLNQFLSKGKKQVQDNLSDILTTVGLNHLRGSQRKKVAGAILTKVINRDDTSFEGLGKSNQWSSLSPNMRKMVSSAFRKHYGADSAGEFTNTADGWRKIVAMDEKFKDLTQSLSDPRAHIQALVNAGQLEALKRYGVVDNSDNVNITLLKDYLLSTNQIGEDGEFLNKNIKDPVFKYTNISSGGHTDSNTTNRGFSQNVSGIGPDISEIRDILRQYPDKTDSVISLLSDINKQLAAGIPTASIPIEEMVNRARNSGINPMNWTVGDLLSSAKNKIKTAGGFMLNQARNLSSFGIGAAKNIFSMAGSAIRQMDEIFADIWIKGEVKARLSKAKLLAGEYYDQQTGKVLRSWKDIKGRVVDKDNNIILDIDEIKNAFVGTKYARALSEVIGSGFKVSKYLFQKSKEVTALLTGGLSGIASSALNTWKKIRPAYDVYVKGDTEPTLFKTGFDRGEYFDRVTNTVVTHPSNIVNEIVDKDGNVLINSRQLQRGLVDSRGVTTGGMISRGIGIVKHYVTRGLSLAHKTFSKIAGITGDMLRGVGGLFYDFFGGIFGYRGEFVKNHQIQTDTQLAILQILKDRLPGRKKIVGDLDGDGDRDGSIDDLRQKRKKNNQDSGKPSSTTSKSKGISEYLSSLGTGISSTLSNLFKKKNNDDSDIGLDDVADASDIASNSKSILSKGWSGLKKLGGKGIGMLKNIPGLSKLMSVLGVVGGVGSGILKMGGGLLGGAARIGAVSTVSALSGIASAALALLTSPVSLAALGLTAGYYGYKYITKNRIGVMSKARLAQYGFQSAPEQLEIVLDPIFKLEELLQPAVVVSKSGEATIDASKFKIEEIYQILGLSENDKEGIRKANYWFNARFKPIFIAHVSAAQAKFQGASLKSLDNQKNKKLLIAHLDATSMPGSTGVYNSRYSPFKEIEFLTMDSQAVQVAIELAKTELAKQITDTGMRPDIAKPMTIAELSQAKAQAEAGYAAKGIGSPDYKPGTADNKPIGISLYGSGSATYLKIDINQLSALDALRYRTYGLVTMESDKIMSIKNLEGWLQYRLSWTKDKPSTSVDVYELVEAASVWFGLPGANSKQGQSFVKWYQNRFLPVFLNYVGGLKSFTGKTSLNDAVKSLDPKDAVTIATAIKGSVSTYGSRQSVWASADSPWRGYELNTDASSIDGNYHALVETSKAVIREEHRKVASAVNRKAGLDKSAKAPKPTGNLFKDTLNKTIHATYQQPRVSISNSGIGVQAAGDYLDGAVVNHNFIGGGGKANTLPVSKGDGWHSNKATIIGAASMVGVDPRLVASVMAVESGFKTAAAASGTSAVGLGQFTSGTWSDTLSKHGAKYGLDPTSSRTDARANSLMTAAYIKDNLNTLKSYLKREVTATDIYLSHLLGPAGAKKFLLALSDNPASAAADITPSAAENNSNIFYIDGDKRRPRSLSEVYTLLTARINNRASDFGVRSSDFTGSTPITRPLAESKQPLKVVLSREPSTDDGTYGKLVLPDGTSFETIELPWRQNRPMVSCIPEGSYRCEYIVSQKFGNVYELKGVRGRSAVLIHAGNRAGDQTKGLKSDSLGCILLGKNRSVVGGQKVVTDSRPAVQEFNDKLAGRTFILEIRNSINQEGSVDQGKPPRDMATVSGQSSGYSAITSGALSIPGTNISSGIPASRSPTSTITQQPTHVTRSDNAESSIAEALKRKEHRASINIAPAATAVEVGQQQRYQEGLNNSNVASINRILNDQLSVQRSIEIVAKQILNQMKSTEKKSAVDSVDKPTQQTIPQKRTSEMPQPAVSMKR